MPVPEQERQDILARIDQLLKEAYALPRSTESWERRLYIDWELFQLFRRLTSDGAPTPSNDAQPPLDEHPRPLRRLDRPARSPF